MSQFQYAIKIPVPTIKNQIDYEFSSLDKIDKFDFLILNLFYIANNEYDGSEKEIKKDEYFANVLKRILNINEKFFPYIKNRIDFFLKSKTLNYINNEKNNFQFEINNLLMGEIDLNSYLRAKFDENKFYYLSENKNKKTIYYYSFLIPEYMQNQDFYFLSEDAKSSNGFLTDEWINNDWRYEITKNDYINRTTNIIEEIYSKYIKENRNRTLIYGIRNIAQEIIFLEQTVTLNFNSEFSLFSIKNANDIKILNFLISQNKKEELEKLISEYFRFNCQKTFTQIKHSNFKYLPIYFFVEKYNEKEIQKICQNYELIKSLFKENGLNYTFLNEKIFSINFIDDEILFDSDIEIYKTNFKLKNILGFASDEEIKISLKCFIAEKINEINLDLFYKEKESIPDEIKIFFAEQFIKKVPFYKIAEFPELLEWLITEYENFFNKSYIERISDINFDKIVSFYEKQENIFVFFIKLDAKNNQVLLNFLRNYHSNNKNFYKLIKEIYGLNKINSNALCFPNWEKNREVFEIDNQIRNKNWELEENIGNLEEWHKKIIEIVKDTLSIFNFDFLIRIKNCIEERILDLKKNLENDFVLLAKYIRKIIEEKFSLNKENITKDLLKTFNLEDNAILQILELRKISNLILHDSEEAKKYQKKSLNKEKYLEIKRWIELLKPIISNCEKKQNY